MGKIKILKDVVANRIAAGEVVERPESIVKELVENSIDSKADKIDVFIKNGGKIGITIIDNGCGMSYDDSILAFERHATSKITTEQDLEGISTLGFRGEALPSIGSVSKLILKTCQTDETEGTIVKIEGGTIKNVVAAPCEKGTFIEVSSLFFNMPARKKFLKSVETEYGRIVRVVNSYALANPSIAFSLVHNGKTVISYSKRQKLADRVSMLLGKEFSFSELDNEGISIKAFLMPPEAAIKSTAKQYFLLNGRFVKERTISSALLSAYKTSTSFFSGYPQAVLWMNIPHFLVDVNVHPSKLEVRFRNQGTIYNLVKEVCMKGLAKRTTTPEIYFNDNNERITLQQNQTNEYRGIANRQNSYSYQNHNQHFPDFSGDLVSEALNTVDNNENNSINNSVIQNEYIDYKVIGQYQNSYIIAEKDSELYIIDQHVAHERILYEQSLDRLANGSFDKTNLLIPEIVNVGMEILPLIMTKSQIFAQSGFNFQIIDDKTVKITSVPVFLPQKDISKTFLEIIAVIIENKEKDINELYKDLAATVGCKAAIKAHTNLSYTEMQRLLIDVIKTDNPYYCPHGRPIIIKLTLSEIEKLFKRK